ncbi:uncharacterized protein LOC120336416 [Styela clava]
MTTESPAASNETESNMSTGNACGCLHGGKCVTKLGEQLCACPTGFGGRRCDKLDIDFTQKSNVNSNVGLVAGLVTGGFILIALIVASLVIWRRWRMIKKKRKSQKIRERSQSRATIEGFSTADGHNHHRNMNNVTNHINICHAPSQESNEKNVQSQFCKKTARKILPTGYDSQCLDIGEANTLPRTFLSVDAVRKDGLLKTETLPSHNKTDTLISLRETSKISASDHDTFVIHKPRRNAQSHRLPIR